MAFHFVSGNHALDFVGTLRERRTTRVETLQGGADVAAWLVGAGVLDARPTTGADGLQAAVALRDALASLVERLINEPGRPLASTDLQVLNAAAAEPPPTVTLRADRTVTRSGTWRAGLSAVARDGIALTTVTNGELKWCADPACTHPFIDRSRGHQRRWCGMSGCGDRAKAAAYRARRRSHRG